MRSGRAILANRALLLELAAGRRHRSARADRVLCWRRWAASIAWICRRHGRLNRPCRRGAMNVVSIARHHASELGPEAIHDGLRHALQLANCLLFFHLALASVTRDASGGNDRSAAAGRHDQQLHARRDFRAGRQPVAIANTFWVHNDSGDSARFFAMSPPGELLGTFPLADAPPTIGKTLPSVPRPAAATISTWATSATTMRSGRSITVHRTIEPHSTSWRDDCGGQLHDR